MEKNGKLIKCDRCGEQVFLPWIGKAEFDGGYTRIDKFAPVPKGWECINRHFHKHALRNLCPTCSEKYEYMLSEFWKDSDLENEQKEEPA